MQCLECLLCWNQGIYYCTCVHLLRENQSSRRIHRWQWYVLSGRLHGNRHVKTEEQRQHFIAHNSRKRGIKKYFQGIHDHFQQDLRFRDSQLRIDRTSKKSASRSPIACRPTSFEIFKELVDLSPHIWTQCTDETPIRLRRRINEIAPSSP